MPKNRCRVFKTSLKEFCKNTSFHGYKYFVAKGKNKSERFIWFLLILSLHIAALVVSLIAYQSFKTMPTITLTDSTHNPIWNYPFPAVTLCNINKISREKAYNLSQFLKFKPAEMTTDELAVEFRILSQIINQNDDAPELTKRLVRLQDILDSNGLDAHEVLRLLAPGCELLTRCLWKNEEKRCESLMEEVATTDGYCCTFNYYGLKNHTFQGLYPNKAPKGPRRLSACGYATALELVLKNNIQDYFAVDFIANGFRAYVHHPYEFADWSIPFLFMQSRTVSFMSLAPSLTYASKNVKDLDIKKRGCLLHNEQPLQGFQFYTYHNCMTECRMNITIKYCSCIPFYYYNKNGQYYQTTRICNLKDVPCLRQIKSYIFDSTPGFHLQPIDAYIEFHKETLYCNCMPTCEYCLYPYEGSMGMLDNDYINTDINLYIGLNMTAHSVLRVFFSDLTAKRNRYDVYYNWDVLLALFGGILGLFIGFSFVSGYEIIYYFVVKPFILLCQSDKTKSTT